MIALDKVILKISEKYDARLTNDPELDYPIIQKKLMKTAMAIRKFTTALAQKEE